MLDRKEVLENTINNRIKIIEGFENSKPYQISKEKIDELKINLEYFKNKLNEIKG